MERGKVMGRSGGEKKDGEETEKTGNGRKREVKEA